MFLQFVRPDARPSSGMSTCFDYPRPRTGGRRMPRMPVVLHCAGPCVSATSVPRSGNHCCQLLLELPTCGFKLRRVASGSLLNSLGFWACCSTTGMTPFKCLLCISVIFSFKFGLAKPGDTFVAFQFSYVAFHVGRRLCSFSNAAMHFILAGAHLS